MKLFTAVLCLVLAADGSGLDFYEGDICKEENGSLWTCEKFDKCPKARDDLKKIGKRPQLCKLNEGESDAVVCCEPQRAIGSKSKDMCKKYAESVVTAETDFAGQGTIFRDTCGAVEPFSLSPSAATIGKNAKPMEFPHMALVGYGEKRLVQWLCGGSLISEQFVLSAAHCSNAGKKGPARWVRLGEYNVKSTADDRAGLARPENYEIIERINYPEYNTWSDYHDIALYKLSRQVQFNEYIRPICLQMEHQFPYLYVIATGWGRKVMAGQSSEIMKKMNLTITLKADCRDAYNIKTARLQHGIKDDIMFCAGEIVKRNDTWQVGSGEPLLTRLSDPYCMYKQVGITSFGFKKDAGKPGLYTRVSYYVLWIESVVWP